MPDFSCEILGLHLQSPFIVKTAKFLDQIDENLLPFIGALMLMPFPQEIIEKESDRVDFLMHKVDLSPYLTDSFLVDHYLKQVIGVKQKYKIPIIAGIDCYDTGNILKFCKLLEKIKIDSLLLNIFIFPDDKDFRSNDYEKIYLELAAKIAYSIEMPILLSFYQQFTNIFYMVDQLFYRGIQGFLISTNFSRIDIDIENFDHKILPYFEKINPNYCPIKWIAYLSSFFHKADFLIDLSGDEITAQKCIKHILAGSKGIIIPFNELPMLVEIINEIDQWMATNGFQALEHFMGQLNFQRCTRPWQAERENYLQYFYFNYSILKNENPCENN